jgi:hypothetical protein
MKKLMYLPLWVALFLAFSSCTKEDDFSIIGSWTTESLKVAVDFGIPGTEPIEIIEEVEPTTIVFFEDGTGTQTNSEGTIHFNWELAGKTLKIIEEYGILTLSLTTMKDKKIVGVQTFTLNEFMNMMEMFDLTDEEKEAISMFENFSVKLTLTLVR